MDQRDKRMAAVVGVWLAALAVFGVLFTMGAYQELGDDGGEVSVGFPFGWVWEFDASESDLIVYVAAGAGLIGSLVYASRALAQHVARQDFGAPWSVWYLVRPFVGAVLGAATVLAVAAGLITGGIGSDNIEPGGVMVIGFIAGLFSKQVMEKFKELVAVLFSQEPTGDQSIQAKIKMIRSLEAGGDLTPQQATDKITNLLKQI